MQYARAYLYAESEKNDVAYFLDYHLRVVLKAIRQVHDRVPGEAAPRAPPTRCWPASGT